MPPVTVLVNEITEPVHTIDGPLIVPAEGPAPMVTSAVSNEVPQAVVLVKVMMAVPLATPVTTPVVLIEAIAALLVLQTPPIVVSASVVVPPAQAEGVPVIAPTIGAPLTVTSVDTEVLPQVLVTV